EVQSGKSRSGQAGSGTLSVVQADPNVGNSSGLMRGNDPFEGGGRPEPLLYGIWDVEQFSVDGQLRPPLLTDNERWHRVILEMPRVAVERGYNSFAGYRATVDLNANMLALTKPNSQTWKSNFRFQRRVRPRAAVRNRRVAVFVDATFPGADSELDSQLASDTQARRRVGGRN